MEPQLTTMEMRRTFVEFEKRDFKARRISRYRYRSNVKGWMRMDEPRLRRWFDKFFTVKDKQ